MDFVGPQTQDGMHCQYQRQESHKTEQAYQVAIGKSIYIVGVGAIATLDNKAVAVAAAQPQQYKNTASKPQKRVNTEQQQH